MQTTDTALAEGYPRPRLSFVIPTRNRAAFLRTCIDSCLAQAVPHAEIVVIDGLSTDETVQVLESYGAHLRFLSEPDAGQADAVNKGVRLATGQVIAWLNADDYYPHAGVLRRVLAAFDEADDVDIVYGHGMMVDRVRRPLTRFVSYPLAAPKAMATRGRCFALQPAVFFTRQLFLAVGGLDPSLHWAMDYDLWFRLFPRARQVRFLDEDLACAMVHADAKSVRGLLPQIRELQQIKRRYLRHFALGPHDWARLLAGEAGLYAYWLAIRLGLWKVT
jgi:glycosyltransferase involved in cell wall biosynthesis